MALHEHESASPQPYTPNLDAWRIVEEGEEPMYHLIADGQKVGEADIYSAGDKCYIDYLGPEAELEVRHLLDPFFVALAVSIRRDYPKITDIEDYNGNLH